MNNTSDYYHQSHPQMEGDQHNMQQQQRYPGGANRGTNNYSRQAPGQGNIQRHQHPSQPNAQQQQGQMAQQPGQNVAIRAHIPHNMGQPQQQYVFTQPQVQLMYPGTQLPMYRYTTPQYPQTQYQPGQSYVVTQQQPTYNPQIYTGYPGHVFYPTSAAQPQGQMHQAAQPYYQQPVQPAAMSMQFNRTSIQTGMSVQQTPTQPAHAAHAVTVPAPQTQMAPSQQSVLNVLPSTAMPTHFVTPATMPLQESKELPKRERRILNILNPTTGEKVIKASEGAAPSPSASPQPTAEPVGVPEIGQDHPKQDGGTDATNSTGCETNPDQEEGIVEEEKKIDCKQEFYLRITEAAESTTGRSNSTPEVVTQPQPPKPSHPSPAVPVGSVALESLVAASAPSAFVHSHVPTSATAKQPDTNLTPEEIPTEQTPEVEAPSPSAECLSSTPAHKSVAEVPPPEPESGVTEPVLTKDEPAPVPSLVTATEEEMNNTEFPPTPGRGGRGDQSLDVSLASISPEPIEKYIQDTPEKTSVPPNQHTESGEPTAVVKDADSSDPLKANPALPDQELDKLEKGIEELKITAVEPAQLEPTFTNGGNDIGEGSGDEDLEEGEVHEGDGESDEAGEPIRKRIVYDRDSLISFKGSASKDLVEGIDSIPPELIRDGNSNSSVPPIPRPQIGGGYVGGGGGYGRMQQGGRMGGGSMGTFPARMGSGGQGQQNWMRGNVPFQLPPPPPGPNRPPVTISLKEVKLDKAENPWKPGRNVDATKDKEQMLVEEMQKKTRGILNKLTPENFDKLVEKFLTLKFEEEVKEPEKRTDEERTHAEAITAERIGAVISVIFEKAIDEPSFSTSYAQMVQRVHAQASAVTSKIFRKKILDQCQKEFQQGNSIEEDVKVLEEKLADTEEDKKPLLQLEIEEKKFTARRRSLGNVRFIGELFKLQMLTPKIMIECVNMLIGNGDEESLECLCKLLTTVGHKLETDIAGIIEKIKSAKQPTMQNKWCPDSKFITNTFIKLHELSQDKKHSSRIRFALLDVYELRAAGWKPRRDLNAPKTIQEVHRAAQREEAEEKKQLMNLPQPPLPSRGGPMPQMSSQPKKGEWSTVDTKKSSRFAQGKKTQSDTGGDVRLGPTGSPALGPGWATGRGGYVVRGAVAPRFSNYRDFSEGPTPAPSRNEIVQELPQPRTPSSQSSRESSRPHTPTRENNTGSPRLGPPVRKTPPPTQPQSRPQTPPEQIEDFDVKESVKQIFSEFCMVKKLDYDWMEKRFPGKRVLDFVNELSLQVCDTSKEEQQKTAGGLIKNLIKTERLTKAQFIQSLKDNVLVELPDIEVDVPKATAYFAMFLSEVFVDDEDLAWLIPFGEPLEGDYNETWQNLVSSVITTLKIRRTEEAVQTLYKKTPGKNRLPIQDSDSWIYGETHESIVEKLNKVLRNIGEDDKLPAILQENSFDIRQELVEKAVAESICLVCWSENGSETWNEKKLEGLFRQLPKQQNTKHFPIIWNQIKDFIKHHNVNSDQEDVIWGIISALDMAPKEK